MATIGQRKAKQSKTGTYTNSRGVTYTASGGRTTSGSSSSSSGGSSGGVLTGSAEQAVRSQIANIQSGINQLASSQGKSLRQTTSGSWEAVPITSDKLNAPALDIPTPSINTTPNSNIDANNLGLVPGLADYGVMLGKNNQLEVAPQPQEGQTNQQNLNAQRIKSLIGLEDYLPNAEKIARESGQRQVEEARREVQNYTGQLNTITANRDAQQLALEGQGRGQTTSFLGGEQARIAREAAIQALPIQGLLASAQGNLELAQQHFETTFKMKMEDARSRYEYKSNLIKSVFDIADKAEQRILDAQEKQADRNFSLYSSDINRFSSMIPDLIQNGDAKIAAKLAQLPKLDVTSPTFAKDYASFQQQASSILAGAKSNIVSGGGSIATGGTINQSNLDFSNPDTIRNLPVTDLTKSVMSGTIKLKDLTPTDKSAVAQELYKVGFNANQYVENKLNKLITAWEAVSDTNKGLINYYTTPFASNRFKDVAEFESARQVLTREIARLNDVGVLSDQDVASYTAALPSRKDQSIDVVRAKIAGLNTALDNTQKGKNKAKVTGTTSSGLKYEVE